MRRQRPVRQGGRGARSPAHARSHQGRSRHRQAAEALSKKRAPLMSHTFDNPFEQQETRRPWAAYGVGALLLMLVALGIWRLANSQAVSIKKEEPVSQLLTVPPPPPTPPPPKPQEQPKEQPTPVAQPQPQAQPKAPAPANNAVTENADAQAGPGDGFNIGAGNGEGMNGGRRGGRVHAALF